MLNKLKSKIDNHDTEYLTTDSYYLPDVNKPQAVLGMLLSIQLVVGSLALMKYPIASEEFIGFFWALSFLMLWIGMVFAVVMHLFKGFLSKQNVWLSTVLQLVCLLGITVLVSYLAKLVVAKFLAHTNLAILLQKNTGQFYLNNMLLSLLIGGLLMRYFYIAHQNKQKIKAVSAAKIQALQSRIRPHFLFNSLNSIAALIKIDPDLAEQAVEDLSDLFRASLADSKRRISIKEELEISRLYQRIEQLRLGERLKVKWNISALPMRQKVPALLLQPLLENAIYHGIEPTVGGGTITVDAKVEEVKDKKMIEILIQNPLPESQLIRSKQGNQIALKNIEQRLRLVYADNAKVSVNRDSGLYQVSLRFPYEGEDV